MNANVRLCAISLWIKFVHSRERWSHWPLCIWSLLIPRKHSWELELFILSDCELSQNGVCKIYAICTKTTKYPFERNYWNTRLCVCLLKTKEGENFFCDIKPFSQDPCLHAKVMFIKPIKFEWARWVQIKTPFPYFLADRWTVDLRIGLSQALR